jgi:hypothetical protein
VACRRLFEENTQNDSTVQNQAIIIGTLHHQLQELQQPQPNPQPPIQHRVLYGHPNAVPPPPGLGSQNIRFLWQFY